MHVSLLAILSRKISTATTHHLESSSIFCGCSGWHPWRSHSFPFIHPRGVFLAWCWVITRPLSSCGIVLMSLPLGVGLTGMGLVHLFHTWQTPMHKRMPASDAMRRSWLQCRMHEFPYWSFTSYDRMSVIIWHTPHEVCPPICPWSSSSLEKHPSWLRWDYQTSSQWNLFSGHCTISVFEPLP